MRSNSHEQIRWHCITHEQKSECVGECALQKVFALFGKKHTLAILRLLILHEKQRYNEIERGIGGSPKTITERLRDLEKHGLIHRRVFNEIPIKVEYSLTKAGQDLEGMFEMISAWTGKWMSGSS